MTRFDTGFLPEEERALRIRAKQELRSRMRALRRVLPAEARRARSTAIADRIVALPAFDRAAVVAGFVAMRDEVELSTLHEAVERSGKTLVLPRVNLETTTLTLHAHRVGGPLEPNAFGVLEPPDGPAVAYASVDLVLVPALAVDERGHRIGFGKGFYDRLLPSLTNAIRCAVAFDFQLVAEVPDTEHDARVDLVITDTRTIDVSTVV